MSKKDIPKKGAYDYLSSLEELKKYYKRCKKAQFFIASDSFLEETKPICPTCGLPVTPDKDKLNGKGNRCIYYPKTQFLVVQHYACAWKSLFNVVFSYRLEGGKLVKIE